jgi:hypothetical protein
MFMRFRIKGKSMKTLFDVRGLLTGEKVVFYQDGKWEPVTAVAKPASESQNASYMGKKTAIAHLHAPQAKCVTDKCQSCDNIVIGRRTGSRFCSNKCRQKHYQVRSGKQLGFGRGKFF